MLEILAKISKKVGKDSSSDEDSDHQGSSSKSGFKDLHRMQSRVFKKSGKVITGDRVGNNYVIDVWVKVGSSADPNATDVDHVASGFARPGAAP